MEKLNFEKMEVINGGDTPSTGDCFLAGLGIVGALFLHMYASAIWSVQTAYNCATS